MHDPILGKFLIVEKEPVRYLMRQDDPKVR